MGKTNKKNNKKNKPAPPKIVSESNLDSDVTLVHENRSGQRPFVSVICPTWNRRRFLPNVIQQFLWQTYPQEYMEMIIADDSPESNEDIIPKLSNIKYRHSPDKMILSNKRNYLNSLATGDIIVCFDDDDFYSLDRVAHVVTKLCSSRCLIAGSSIIHIYYKSLNKIIEFGPYGPNHGTNGTMAYRKEYLNDHRYEDDKQKAEEAFFTNNFSEPMVQLDPHKVMLCLAHNSNTVDKDPFIEKGKMTPFDLKRFFKSKNTSMINWIKNDM
jgi:glycosyltransferase involved in cell wall biosynthesis